MKELRNNPNHRIKAERVLRCIQCASSVIAAAGPAHIVALLDVVVEATLPSLRTAFEAECIASFTATCCLKAGIPSSSSSVPAVDATQSLNAFLRRVLALVEIDANLRPNASTSSAPSMPRALQLALFDKYPVGSFAIALVQLTCTLPRWWDGTPSVAGGRSLRQEIIHRIKQWEPSVGGPISLHLLLDQLEARPLTLIEHFWHESEFYDSENTI